MLHVMEYFASSLKVTHSNSLEMAPFDRMYGVSCNRRLSCIVDEIKRDIARIFHTPVFDALVRGPRPNIAITFGQKKTTRMVGLPDSGKSLMLRLADGQRDRQTEGHLESA